MSVSTEVNNGHMRLDLSVNLRNIVTAILLSFFLSSIISYLVRSHAMSYYLTLSCKSSADTMAELFYDTGYGYNQSESHQCRVFKSEILQDLIFPLPKEKIYNLRFDPLKKEGEFQIIHASIKAQYENRGKHEILHEFHLGSFVSVKDTLITNANDGSIVVTVPSGATDPICEIPLIKNLNHWEYKDFLDREWFKQSIFTFIIISPIIFLLLFICERKFTHLSSLTFLIGNDVINLNFGESFKSNRSLNFYRDISEDHLNSIITDVKNGKDWRTAINDKYVDSKPWLCDIVSNPKRVKFTVDFLKPKDLSILDIGAGWGQNAVPLAKRNTVCALEPTPERLKFIEVIAHQEQVNHNMFFLGSNYFDLEFKTKFDLILSIGVLEWSGQFTISEISPESAQLKFLKKIKRDLSDKGKLVVGIENRLGLKYILGANDDHIGLPLISCLRNDLAKVKFQEKTNHELQCFTYSLGEYKNLLIEAGFSDIRFFASLPDYKLPEKIFSISNDLSKSGLNEFILDGGKIKDHDGTNGEKLDNQDEIDSIYQSLAEMNLAHYFSPSFYIEAL